MEKSAIEQIQHSANIPALLKQLIGTKTPVVALPKDFNLTSLESYMPERSSYRLSFETDTPKDFFAYAHGYDNADAKCFISSRTMSAKVVFDLGNTDVPLHQNHKAKLSLKQTEAFKSLLNINGAHLSQKEASDFIEDWSEHLVITSNTDQAMTPAVAAKQLRDLTIEAARSVNSKVHDFGAEASAFDSIEAKNADALPSFIKFACVPYNGLQERSFELRLSVITSSDKPKVSMRVIKLESVQEDITNEFKELVVEGFAKCELQTFIGEI